jgi:hypothetical protein
VVSGVVVAVQNRKGGVGKTTLVRDLGFALAEQGRRVLQVGLDPQSSLEVLAGLGFDTPPERTVSRLLVPGAFGDRDGGEPIVATGWGRGCCRRARRWPRPSGRWRSRVAAGRISGSSAAWTRSVRRAGLT